MLWFNVFYQTVILHCAVFIVVLTASSGLGAPWHRCAAFWIIASWSAFAYAFSARRAIEFWFLFSLYGLRYMRFTHFTLRCALFAAFCQQFSMFFISGFDFPELILNSMTIMTIFWSVGYASSIHSVKHTWFYTLLFYWICAYHCYVLLIFICIYDDITFYLCDIYSIRPLWSNVVPFCVVCLHYYYCFCSFVHFLSFCLFLKCSIIIIWSDIIINKILFVLFAFLLVDSIVDVHCSYCLPGAYDDYQLIGDVIRYSILHSITFGQGIPYLFDLLLAAFILVLVWIVHLRFPDYWIIVLFVIIVIIDALVFWNIQFCAFALLGVRVYASSRLVIGSYCGRRAVRYHWPYSGLFYLLMRCCRYSWFPSCSRYSIFCPPPSRLLDYCWSYVPSPFYSDRTSSVLHLFVFWWDVFCCCAFFRVPIRLGRCSERFITLHYHYIARSCPVLFWSLLLPHCLFVPSSFDAHIRCVLRFRCYSVVCLLIAIVEQLIIALLFFVNAGYPLVAFAPVFSFAAWYQLDQLFCDSLFHVFFVCVIPTIVDTFSAFSTFRTCAWFLITIVATN